MDFFWYEGSPVTIGQNKIRDDFKRYMLVRYKKNRTNNLDNLIHVLKNMDREFEDHRKEYTKDKAKFLKDNSIEALESLKNDSLKSLVNSEHIKGRTTKGIEIDTIPDDYKLEDTKNMNKTNALIGKPVTEGKEKYSVQNVLDRFRETDTEIEHDRKTTENTDKITINVKIPAGSLDSEFSKMSYWKKDNQEMEQYAPKSTNPRNYPKKKFVRNLSELKEKIKNLRYGEKITEKEFEKDIVNLIINEYRNDIFKPYLDIDDVLDPLKLYDIEITIEFVIEGKLQKEELYEMEPEFIEEINPDTKEVIFNRITGRPNRITNPNYVEGTDTIRMDKEGKPIKRWDNEEIPHLMRLYVSRKFTPHKLLRPKTGTGPTERIYPSRKEKEIADIESKKQSPSRKDYLGFVKAMLQKLEKAVKNIPEGS